MKRLIGFALFAGAIAYGANFIYNQLILLKKICINFRGLRINKLGLRDANITLIVEIKNKSNIGLLVRRQNYDIYINNKFVANISDDKKIKLIAGEETISEFDIQFDPAEVIGIAISGLFSGFRDLMLHVKGYLAITGTYFSFNRLNVDFTGRIGDLTKGESEKC